MMPLQSNGTNYTDKDNTMVAKRPTGERPKQLSKLASKVYMKETRSPSQAAARAGAARDKINKAAAKPAVKVSQATINKIKADGMQTAIKKAASSRQSPEYTKGVSRMYGEKRIQNAYLKYYQPGKAVPATGPKPKSIAQSVASGVGKAIKDIPKIPGAAAKTIAQKAKKPGRN